MSTAMTLRPAERDIVGADALMPVLSIEQAIGRYNTVVEFTKRVMKEGRDYGIIPGTEKKNDDGTPSSKSNTLLKPGAEKLCTLFGLVPSYEDYRVVEDWDKGLFYYAYRCRLTRHGNLVAEAIGSANSREKKYRRAVRKCPDCGAPAIKRSKFPPRNAPKGTEPGWYCHDKAGGCGANFEADEPAIVSQQLTTDPNDAADQINTLQKMAQKRALVAVALVATNASEFFTQDVEDLGYIDAEFETHDMPPRALKPFGEQIDEALKVRGFQPADIETVKQLIVKQTGGIEDIDDVPVENRPLALKAIADGKFDSRKKTPAPAKSEPAGDEGSHDDNSDGETIDAQVDEIPEFPNWDSFHDWVSKFVMANKETIDPAAGAESLTKLKLNGLAGARKRDADARKATATAMANGQFDWKLASIVSS